MKQKLIAGGVTVFIAVVLSATFGVANAKACSPADDGYGDVISSPTFFDGQCVPGETTPPTGSGWKAPGYSQKSYGFVIPRDNGQDALAGVTSKQGLYDRLRYDYFTRGWGQQNWWAKDGAAFVVLTLIGRPAPYDRNLTDSDWNELQNRLNNPALTLSPENHSLSPNSTSVYIDPAASHVGSNIDFAFYTIDGAGTGPSVVLRQNGVEVAALERQCANMLGNLPLPQAWSTWGESHVGVGSPSSPFPPNVTFWPGNPAPPDKPALPGSMLTWNHAIHASGGTTPPLGFAVGKSGFNDNPSPPPRGGVWGNGAPANNNWPIATTSPIAAGSQYDIGWGANYSDYSSYVVQQYDVGHRLCEYISWGPSDSTKAPGDSWASTANLDRNGNPTTACVDIPYQFNLTTQVNMKTAVTEPGTVIAPSDLNIINSGPTRGYDNTSWQASKFVLGPNDKRVLGAADNQPSPCAAYGSCTSIGTGSGTYDPGTSFVGQVPAYTVEDLQVGSRVCFALSVNKYNQDQGSGKMWYDGAPACVMIGKKPKVQVLGGDAATRASINVGLTQKNTGVYGSWVEYGAFSVGTNVNFATGAGLSANPAAQTSSAQASWSKLTFANVDASSNPRYGQYYTSVSGFRQLPAIAQYFSALSSGAPAFSGDKPSGNTFATGGPVQVRTAGDLTLHQDQLGLDKNSIGQSVVIVSNGTVTIDGDLTYINGELQSINQIPQLVIIAKNINITNNTKQIDAWLIATDATNNMTGIINTCSDGPVSLTGSDCNNPLTIHGPVEARQLLLRRTAGSGTGQPASGDPAEVFDLRADTYLWAAQVAAGAGKAQTVYTTELPPRF